MKSRLILGDCLEEMDKLIQDGIVVDAIITDPPYELTNCKWDKVIPFPEMWARLNKLIKPNGAIVLFGSEPFSSALRMSNIGNYKYDWIWEKNCPTGHLNAKHQPLRKHEIISVFYKKKATYNPKMRIGRFKQKGSNAKSKNDSVYGRYGSNKTYNNKYYPTSILQFDNSNQKNKQHPTAKPIKLMEYLIKTYTVKNELILDFTMGSGTTCLAAQNTDRKFIGIEKERVYFDIAEERIYGGTQDLFRMKRKTK